MSANDSQTIPRIKPPCCIQKKDSSNGKQHIPSQHNLETVPSQLPNRATFIRNACFLNMTLATQLQLHDLSNAIAIQRACVLRPKLITLDTLRHTALEKRHCTRKEALHCTAPHRTPHRTGIRVERRTTYQRLPLLVLLDQLVQYAGREGGKAALVGVFDRQFRCIRQQQRQPHAPEVACLLTGSAQHNPELHGVWPQVPRPLRRSSEGVEQ